MKKILIISIIAFAFLGRNYAQTNTGKSINASFDVGATGGLTYQVPFEIPSYVLGHFPNLGLVYNSQAGDGVAGYGWNISGLSAITRIAATKYHDGFIDPVDFNENDRFSLDGQRLILKTGEYGKNGSTYQTESYSNLKIEASGTFDNEDYSNVKGPEYFIVTHPNGVRYWYGYLTSSIQWTLWKIEDPHGNSVYINYFKDGDILNVANVVDPVAKVKVEFNYTTKSTSNYSAIGGSFYRNKQLLKSIDVLVNNTENYYTYEIEHETTSKEFYKVTKIKQKNRNNEYLSPIEFLYPEKRDYTFNLVQEELDSSIGDRNNSTMIPCDINGDEELDFISYNYEREGSHYKGINFIKGLGQDQFSTTSFKEENLGGAFNKVFIGKYLNNLNQIDSKQGLILLRKNSNKIIFDTYELHKYGTFLQPINRLEWVSADLQPEIPDNALYITQTPSDTSIKLNINSESIVATNTIGMRDFATNYISQTGIWLKPNFHAKAGTEFKATIENNKPTYYDQLDKTYLSGDFNSDGITDILAISKSTGETYLIDLNPTNKNPINLVGKIENTISDSTKLFTGDFDGDGLTDIYHFIENKLKIYSLDNNSALKLKTSLNNTNFKTENFIGLGDFNGDGKTDVFNSGNKGSRTWQIHYSNAVSFNTRSFDFGFSYYPTDTATSFNYKDVGNKSSIREENYILMDYDKDGNTDFIHHMTYTPIDDQHKVSHQEVSFYTNKTINSVGTPNNTFEWVKRFTHSNLNSPRFGHSSVTNFENRNLLHQYSFINSSGEIQSYHLNHNHNEEVTLSSVMNNGLNTYFTYEGITDNQGTSVYKNYFNQNYEYPYVQISHINSLKVIESIRQEFDNKTREKHFRYGGLLSSTNGRGILGFNFIAKSNWYNGNISDIWKITEFDLLKGGVPKETLTQLGYNYYIFSERNSYWEDISTTKFEYSYQLNDNKTYVTFPTKTTSTDHLKNITIINTNDLFDEYYNILETTQSFNGGKTTTAINYDNNPNGTGANYFIGRPTSKTETTILGTEQISSSEEYIYENNFLKQLKIKGHNTDWLTENYEHDSFGNIVKESISGEENGNSINRVTEKKYDATGRFLEWYKDTEGFITHYKYDKTIGKLEEKTNPFGKKTSYQYDNWNRLTQEKDHLNNTITTDYQGTAGGGIKINIKNSFGGESESYANRLGWIQLSKSKNALGQWVQNGTEYDAVGKKTRISQPSFDTPTQWNTTHFNEYNKPYINNLYNGKKIETTYYENQIEIDDGQTIRKITFDALGNKTSVTDAGGTIKYKYHANNTPKETIYDGHTITTKIDGWGRKIELYDPAAGTYSTKYNILGEILEETTPNGKTSYTLDSTGKITQKKVKGNQTDLEIFFEYYPTHKQIKTISGTDIINNSSYSYEYLYDEDHRPIKVTETMPLATFEKTNKYDILGRVDVQTYKSTLSTGTGGTSQTDIKSHYHPNSGHLYKLSNNNSSNTLYEVTELNARGQTLSGTTNSEYKIDNTFDAYGMPTKKALNKHTEVGHPDAELPDDIQQIVGVTTKFDHITGNLTNRNNSSFSGGSEYFEYDDLDRLTKISGAYNHTQSYEANGNIKTNSFVGTYNYEEASTYRVNGIDLNTAGQNHYQNHTPQQISYNADKKPVSIYEENNGRVDFEYGIIGNRSIAYYGGLDQNKLQRDFTKIYSAIIPAEIIINNNSNTTKFITYTGGDAYTAPLAHIKQTGTDAINDFMYLFRDHLGSILSIIDSQGTIQESTHYGAWGKVKEFSNHKGATAFNYTNSLLGRGYTGHEHFTSVGLIHMNGRMYDANLGRFLSPDNYIQDPFSTQSFNRYGYVLNNPLKYADPSGEFIPIIIGIVIGAYIGGAMANQDLNPFKWDYQSFDTWSGIIIGAIAGAVGGYQFMHQGLNLVVLGVTSVKGITIPLIKLTITTAGQKAIGAFLALAVANTLTKDKDDPEDDEEEDTKDSNSIDPNFPDPNGPIGNNQNTNNSTDDITTEKDDVIKSEEAKTESGNDWITFTGEFLGFAGAFTEFKKYNLTYKGLWTGKNGRLYYVNRQPNGITGPIKKILKLGAKYKNAGSAVTGLTILLSGVDMAYGYYADNSTFGYNFYKALGRAIGGYLGGYFGVKVGAAAGFAVTGNLFGAGLGAATFGYASSKAGAEFGEYVVEQIYQLQN